MNWTPSQILDFAPSSGVADSARKLSTPAAWLNRFTNGTVLWGACKGSGNQPYQVAVALQQPAFRCNCASRVRPCKHSLALFLFYATNTDGFVLQTDLPADLQAWLNKQQPTAPAPEPPATVDTPASDSLDQRIEAIQDGLQDLEFWLLDIARQGIASMEKDAYRLCEEIAVRMTDAKMRSIGDRIREIPLLIGSSPNWTEAVAARLGELYLFVRGFRQWQHLPTNLQEELKAVAGIHWKKKDLLENTGKADEWLVLGKIEGTDPVNPRLTFRRVWLWGVRSKHPALILDYAFGGASFEQHFSLGTQFRAEVVYYPSNYPIRAVIKYQNPEWKPIVAFPGYLDFEEFQTRYAQALAGNPWLLDFPCVLSAVVPTIEHHQLFLLDKNARQMPVSDKNLMGWKLIALSGGKPIDIFGEWTGDVFVPSSACVQGRFVSL